jgi:predicted ATPase
MTDPTRELPEYDSLSRIHIENFKSIEKTSLDLAPLTVLIGANSRGKSTILQSILVVAQSIGRTKLGEVSLNGEAVNLGTSDEVFHKAKNGQSRSRACIGIEVSFARHETGAPFQSLGGSRISEQFFFDRSLARSRKGVVAARELKQTLSKDRQKDHVELSKLDSSKAQKLGRSVFRVSVRKSGSSDGSNLRAREYFSKKAQATYLVEPEDGRGKGVVSSDRAHLLDTLQLFEWSLETNPVLRLKGTKPSGDVTGEEQKTLEIEHALPAIVRDFYDFLLARSTFLQVAGGKDIYYLPRIEIVVRNWANQDKDQFFWRVIRHLDSQEGKKLLHEFALSSNFLNVAFLATSIADFDETKYSWSSYLSRQTQYLGPLREKDATSSVGKLDFSYLTPLGPKAEFLADFVFEKQSVEIDFPTPSGVNSQKQTYREALEKWACDYFQLGAMLSVSEEGRSGPVLRVNGNRLQHLGTGVSQILPVIAICLWAKPGSTVILEQPELHLHPGLQQKLGTFLTVVASTGRQVIVETHSEYLLTRVRRHIAEGHVPEDSCTLVFVQGDGSVVQRPALSGGDSEEWPEQFLDHSLDDAVAIANLREHDFLDG